MKNESIGFFPKKLSEIQSETDGSDLLSGKVISKFIEAIKNENQDSSLKQGK